MKNLLLFCILLTFLFGCSTKNKDYDNFFNDPATYSKTVFELNTVIMGNNFSPVVGSRNYLYANVAAYEVVAANYPDKYNSLSGQVAGLGKIPLPKPGDKINVPFASLLAFWKLGQLVTFSENVTTSYVDSLKLLAKVHGMPEEMFNQSVAYADTVSAIVMAWSKKDGYKETRGMPEYTVYNDSAGRWVPTPPAYSSAAEPHWNLIRALVLDSANQFAPPPPFTFNVTDKNSAYYKQVMQLKNATDSLTLEQAHIAEFWDDNPFKLNVSGHLAFATKKFSPPGHWMSIVGIAAKKAGADYNTTVYAYTKTAIALFDAFISCWDVKYKYNTVRPETVINKYFDANWTPHLQTPPFPEYTCGHSTGSAACATALTSIFGDNFAYTDTTEKQFGIESRSYKSFRAAALENNAARFYGGIHFHQSCLTANDCGNQIGNLVVVKLKMKK